jgi:hypothetical protein
MDVFLDQFTYAMGEKLDTTRLQIFVSVDRLLRRTQYRGCERELRMEYGAIRFHTWNR